MMITVAKSLDMPIKLLFPRPSPPDMAPEEAKRLHAMLGLGDIVLPGIMIGLALRYDLYMHYLRKQKANSTAADSKESENVKAPFQAISGHQGDVFWTQSWFTGRSLLPPQASTAALDALRDGWHFPRPYFWASMTGYVLGLLTTLVFMHIYDHGQPALLYLVPGVLGSLFITGLVRGELWHMWQFSEAEEEDVEAKKADSKVENLDGNKTDQSKDETIQPIASPADAEKESEIKVGQHTEQVLVSFSISKRLRASGRTGSKGGDKDNVIGSARAETADGESPHKMRRKS
jgi:minor histocompatibility antigen H13